MANLIWVVVGIVGGAAFARAGSRRSDGGNRLFAAGLVIAAAIYVIFAVVAGEWDWVGIESLGVALFSVVAVVGRGRREWLLALGWLIHPLWDLGLHHFFGVSMFAPAWYVWGCLGFDVVVGAFLLVRKRE